MVYSLQGHFSADVCGYGLKTFAVTVFLLASAPAFLFAGIHKVEPARKATAEVVRDGDDWVVTVDFLPSKALGEAKSMEVNRKLARDYAYRGLFREVGGKNGTEVVVSGFQCETSAMEDGRWKARFRAPANGVSFQASSAPEVNSNAQQGTNVAVSVSEVAKDVSPAVSIETAETSARGNSYAQERDIENTPETPSVPLNRETPPITEISTTVPPIASPSVPKPLEVPPTPIASPKIPKPLEVPSTHIESPRLPKPLDIPSVTLPETSIPDPLRLPPLPDLTDSATIRKIK